MSDPSQAAPESPSGGTTEPEVVSPDLVSPEQAESTDQEAPEVEPAKIIRIGGMVKQLLEEVRNTTLDEAARDSLRDIYENSLTELRSALSPDLDAERLFGAIVKVTVHAVPDARILAAVGGELLLWSSTRRRQPHVVVA